MTVLDGIVIGGAGGAIAGITVWLVQYLDTKGIEAIERHRVHQWLRENTKNEEGQRYRSTRAIASWNNLTEERTRYICSSHKSIYLTTGKREDPSSLYERGDRRVYTDRGLTTV